MLPLQHNNRFCLNLSNGQRSKCKSRGPTTQEAEFIRALLTMRKLPILLLGFAFICTVRATVDDNQIIEGLPVKLVSSGKSYKVFEQYPWEGHSSNYGPKGNRLILGFWRRSGEKYSPLFTGAAWRLDSYAGHRLATNK